jgi:hypothetical protein
VNKILLALLLAATTCVFTGCTTTGATDLSDVADATGLVNITTGDDIYHDYKATGYYQATEIGLAFGLPGFGKFMELVPALSNEDLLKKVADMAVQDGANGMINVNPHTEAYLGFPFGILGLYVDTASGTGVNHK